jgi:hypothetical protein
MRAASQVPYLVLLPERFAMPRFLRRERWSLKPPFHPYPHLSARAVFSLWHCLSASPYVVTSRVYLRPNRSYAAPRPMEFGLSSRNFRCERPPALPRRVQGGGWKRVWRVASFLIEGLQCAGSTSGRFRWSNFQTGSEGKKVSSLDRNGCCEPGFVGHIPPSNPVSSLAVLRTHNKTHSSHEDPQIVRDSRSGLGRVRCHCFVCRPFSARRVQ